MLLRRLLIGALSLAVLLLAHMAYAGRLIYGDIAWSPDGSMLVSVSSNITLYTDNLDVIASIDEDTVRVHIFSVSWSPDGSEFATIAEDGAAYSLSVWSAADLQLMNTISYPSDESALLRPLIWHPDGETLVAGVLEWSEEQTSIHMWDAVTLELSDVIILQKGERMTGGSLSISPDGTQLAYGLWRGSNMDGTLESFIRQVDIATGDTVHESSFPSDVSSTAWHESGKLAVGGFLNVSIFDAASGEEIQSFFTAKANYGFNGITDVAWSLDGQYLALAAENDLEVWDLAATQLIHTYDVENTYDSCPKVKSVAWRDSDMRLALGESYAFPGWGARIYEMNELPTPGTVIGCELILAE